MARQLEPVRGIEPARADRAAQLLVPVRLREVADVAVERQEGDLAPAAPVQLVLPRLPRACRSGFSDRRARRLQMVLVVPENWSTRL